MKIHVFAVAVNVCLFAGGCARADDLKLGGSYNAISFYVNGVNQSLGGGSDMTSSLNGVPVAFLYCVDLMDQISASSDYNQTTINTAGVVNGSVVANAGEVAWLLSHYAVAAETNATAQVALQAAIWHVIYGSRYYLDPASAAINLYNSDLAALGSNTAPVSNYDWFSPRASGSSTQLQGLVGAPATVPEPMSILLLGTVLLVALRLARKRLAL